MSWKNDQVTEEETEEILKWAGKVLGVEGDFVELGCYRGDTSLLLAEVLRGYNRGEAVKNLGKTGEKVVKKLWIYDSFEGLPEKSDKDKSALGVDWLKNVNH